MRDTQENLLREKFPTVFREKVLCGVSYPEEFSPVLEKLCRLIEWHIERVKNQPEGNDALDKFKVSQIKEKWGSLCFYHSGADDYISGAIKLAEFICHRAPY